MKESTNKDIVQFFYDKTADYEKNPPDLLWDKINKDVASHYNNPGHFNLFLKNIYLFPILFGGLFIVAFIYFQKSDINKTELNKNIAKIENPSETNDYNRTKNIIVEDVQEKSLNKVSKESEIESNINKEVVVEKGHTGEIKSITTENITNKEVEINKIAPVEFDTSENLARIEIKSEEANEDITIKKRIYNISTSTFKNIEKIHFVKSNGKDELVKEIESPVLSPFGYFEVDITDLPAGTYKVRVLEEGKWLEHKIETFK